MTDWVLPFAFGFGLGASVAFLWAAFILWVGKPQSSDTLWDADRWISEAAVRIRAAAEVNRG